MSAGYASCCVLSYNRPRFLAKCLSTLSENAAYPFELIVHDDGSDDPELHQFLHHLHREGKVSTLILNTPHHNQGVGNAIQRMFQLATGDPIIKIDQDLVFQPAWLRETVDILDRNRADSARGEAPPIGALGAFKYPADPVDHEKMFVKDWGYFEEHEDFVGSFMAVPRYVYADFPNWETHSEAFAEDMAYKSRLKSDDLVMALPPRDLALNVGFGPPFSTVVTDYSEETGGTVQAIHRMPAIFGDDA